MSTEQILTHYQKEYPFQPGEESDNRDRYYWLSGFLRPHSDMSTEQILTHYQKEYPFQPGEESDNRDRYYWLSGFLRSVPVEHAALSLLDHDGYMKRFYSIFSEGRCTQRKAFLMVEAEYYLQFQRNRYVNFGSFCRVRRRWLMRRPKK